jgi:hypothetical protein
VSADAVLELEHLGAVGTDVLHALGTGATDAAFGQADKLRYPVLLSCAQTCCHPKAAGDSASAVRNSWVN